MRVQSVTNRVTRLRAVVTVGVAVFKSEHWHRSMIVLHLSLVGGKETCCSNSCTVLFGIPRVEGKMSFIKKIIKKFKFYLGTEISLNLDIYSCSSDIFPDLYLIIRR